MMHGTMSLKKHSYIFIKYVKVHEHAVVECNIHVHTHFTSYTENIQSDFSKLKGTFHRKRPVSWKQTVRTKPTEKTHDRHKF